jgi:hypothetical protein
MGHTYRELFSEEAELHDKTIKRRERLFFAMSNVPCCKLNVGQLLYFSKLINKFEITMGDLDELEEILYSLPKT